MKNTEDLKAVASVREASIHAGLGQSFPQLAEIISATLRI